MRRLALAAIGANIVCLEAALYCSFVDALLGGVSIIDHQRGTSDV